MEFSFTHFRILYESSDGEDVASLPRRSRLYGDDLSFDWPEMPLHEVREALKDLLQCGYVELVREAGDALVPLAEAVAAVARDEPWETSDPSSPHFYYVAITDASYGVYAELLPRYWPDAVRK